MIDKVITIKSSEIKLGKTPGKQYLEVIDHEDTKFSCWDESLWNSLGKDSSVKVSFEQKGIFKNIITVETSAEPPEHEDKPTEDPTRRSIERQVALKCATEFAVAKLQAGKEIKSTEVASVAIIFDRFVSGNASLEKAKPTKPAGEE